jgi:single-stranded DNA-binding protein
MPYINAAQIPGNLGKDAETMTTPCGGTVIRFSIAPTRPYTLKQATASLHQIILNWIYTRWL